MITSSDFVEAMKAAGFNVPVTVPCSSMAGVLSRLATDSRFNHIAATSEFEAVGIAAGAYLADRQPVLIIQSSGFCDAINGIASLLAPSQIPLPFIVSARGGFGVKDEPQHGVIGRELLNFASSLKLPVEVLMPHRDQLDDTLKRLHHSTNSGGPGAVLAVPPGTIALADPCASPLHKGCPTSPPPRVIRDDRAKPPPREVVIAKLREAIPAAAFVSTTGHTSRELFGAGDSSANFYMVGAMGCASALALGIAVFRSGPVVVLDGDGAMLMRLGNLATIGARRQRNICHVLLNNGRYASTGGQETVAETVDFSAIAAACGYCVVLRTTDISRAVEMAKHCCRHRTGPLFLEVVVDAAINGSAPRPNMLPHVQTMRFKNWLSGVSAPLAQEVEHGDQVK